MTVFINNLLIDAPAPSVFDLMADREAELTWNPKCESVTKLSEGAIGVGSRWSAKWKGGPQTEVETIAYDRPRFFSNHSGGPLEVTMSCTCTPHGGGGTKVDIRFEATPHGFFRLMFPLFERRFRTEFLENGQRIKELAERRAVPLT